MRRHRKAKIVATLGPASATPEAIRALFDAGADVFRLNFSHGAHADHRERFEHIRQIEFDSGRPIGVMMDLQGPKLRVGKLVNGSADLKAGKRFRLDMTATPGDSERAPLPHPEIFKALTPGIDLLLDDGKLRLRVESCGEDFAETTIVTGGRLSDRKGVNVPGAVLPISALTEKDRQDLQYGLDLGADWVALSFVQRPEDVAEARRLIAGRAAVLVKLEKPAAIERLEELIELADAVMVARGDLGVEMPPEDVPALQKRIIAAGREAGKPVVVATQMLDSMVHSPAPTRAEASDVATAVYDGADAVMLSAETASGEYPLESVSMMNRIVRRVEQDPYYSRVINAQNPEPEATAADAISAAAAQVANTLSAAAIVTYTTSGSTTLRAARERPNVPILCLTERIETARRLALCWGTHCVQTKDVSSFSEMVEKAC
ncbi:MAG: pyruvate kinase, partial [Dongiaceae bacterium]